MKLNITPAAQERLKHVKGDRPAKLILDFDDGVGSLSKFGACSMDGGYRLLLVNNDTEANDYSGVIDSNLGSIQYLPADVAQFDDQMELRFDPNYLTMKLVSPNHILSGNVEVVDMRDQQVSGPAIGAQRSC